MLCAGILMASVSLLPLLNMKCSIESMKPMFLCGLEKNIILINFKSSALALFSSLFFFLNQAQFSTRLSRR